MGRLNNVLAAEEQAIISDPAAVRDMTTYCIFAKTGGIGKTRLANAMALLLDKYRNPYQVVTKNKQITFDPFQNYRSETAIIMDELNSSNLGWSQIKDLLDPYKIPFVSSRFHNKSPWNVQRTFITNVFENGIADFVNGVLHYAEGVSSLGYLTYDNLPQQGDDHYVLSATDEPLHRSIVNNIVNRYADLAGVHRIQAKELRTSHACLLINKYNVDILSVSQRLA